MIKITTKEVIEVNDWDKLVEETYGRPYSLQQQDGCKDRGNEYITVPCEYSDDMNETIPEEINGEMMGVKFSTWLERDPKQLIEGHPEPWAIGLFWERNFYPDLNVLANDLYNRGLIEEGDYTINIDW